MNIPDFNPFETHEGQFLFMGMPVLWALIRKGLNYALSGCGCDRESFGGGGDGG